MPMPRPASATATAPLPTPIAPGVIGKAEATSSAGRITSAASTGWGRPSDAATAIVAPTRDAAMAKVQPRSEPIARGERSSAANPSTNCATRGWWSHPGEGACGGEYAHDAAQREYRPHGSAPVAAAMTTSEASARQRAALIAAYTPPAVQSRPGASIAREHSATLTASPSRAGAKQLTSEPMPSRDAAWRGQMRPPAERNADVQAPTVHANAAAKKPTASPSQRGSACPSAPTAGGQVPSCRPRECRRERRSRGSRRRRAGVGGGWASS